MPIGHVPTLVDSTLFGGLKVKQVALGGEAGETSTHTINILFQQILTTNPTNISFIYLPKPTISQVLVHIINTLRTSHSILTY